MRAWPRAPTDAQDHVRSGPERHRAHSSAVSTPWPRAQATQNSSKRARVCCCLQDRDHTQATGHVAGTNLCSTTLEAALPIPAATTKPLQSPRQLGPPRQPHWTAGVPTCRAPSRELSHCHCPSWMQRFFDRAATASESMPRYAGRVPRCASPAAYHIGGQRR